MKLAVSKWKVAALTLVTFPAAFWFADQYPDFSTSKLLFLLGLSPLIVGLGMELRSQWKTVLHKWGNPESHVEASPKGNKSSVILFFILVCLVLFLAFVGAMHRT
jgi:hypothetical protein